MIEGVLFPGTHRRYFTPSWASGDVRSPTNRIVRFDREPCRLTSSTSFERKIKNTLGQVPQAVTDS